MTSWGMRVSRPSLTLNDFSREIVHLLTGRAPWRGYPFSQDLAIWAAWGRGEAR